MTLQRFLSTWDGVNRENRFNRLFILLLIAANIALAVTLIQTDRTVVLVPPTLEHEVTIGRNSASQEAKDVWALFVVELLGHVTPSNANFLITALDPLLAAAIRQEVLKVLDEQTTAIKRENVSLSFEPGAITHDPKNDNIYITGKHVTTGPGAQPVAIERTYVLRIIFQNYRPRVAYLDVYPGPARLSTEPPKPPSAPRGDPS
ncbi:TraE/TraK family type IV conjugative transfer system protein [uncultured Thiodictyon sp.]|uniref:TraE/TraK family type IV conjugative transfer system protein n=1 Tax=uncultured Thiodictyon sp. TaxID=1846217 RepID=UPI0025D0C2BE|nr:TraE/TraK family type IV conjugative transfer system protein [uncultured Thiodictyon sp.]